MSPQMVFKYQSFLRLGEGECLTAIAPAPACRLPVSTPPRAQVLQSWPDAGETGGISADSRYPMSSHHI